MSKFVKRFVVFLTDKEMRKLRKGYNIDYQDIENSVPGDWSNSWVAALVLVIVSHFGIIAISNYYDSSYLTYFTGLCVFILLLGAMVYGRDTASSRKLIRLDNDFKKKRDVIYEKRGVL